MKLRKRNKRDVLAENREEEAHASGGEGRLNTEAKRLIESTRNVERSRMKDNKKKMKLAFRVAGAFAFVAVFEAIAIAALAPMKTVVPYVIKVDGETGFTSVERQFDPVEDSTQAMERFFLRLYVTSRESYDWFSVQSDSNYVQSMSTSEVYSRYAGMIRSEQGPLNVLGDNVRAVVDIKAVTFLSTSGSQKTVQVRFVKRFESMQGAAIPNRNSSQWLATMTFDYSDQQMSEAVKDLNPLNLRVTSYRRGRIDGSVEDD